MSNTKTKKNSNNYTSSNVNNYDENSVRNMNIKETKTTPIGSEYRRDFILDVYSPKKSSFRYVR